MSEIPRSNSQNRLKLLRLNSNSSQFYNKEKKIEEKKLDKETCETISENRCDSSEEDESLADFRSPKSPETNIKTKFKIEVRSPKCKKRLLGNKNKSETKSKQATSKTRKKVSRDRNQPAIESSFFKPKLEELPTVFVCPLCLKSSKNEGVHNTHMKLCANKNKITPKELLDAIQLQERQAEERKALGLVSAPLLQQTKKLTPARLKKFVSCDDPELQLALAISKSLHEAEQIEQLDECEALAAAAGQPIIITSEEERRKTLQSFGFTTNKPLVETNVRSKKKKHVGLTVLQTRSEKEKKCILTERIAEVLVGKDFLSQTQPETTDCPTEPRKTLPLKSRLLQNIIQVDNPLWVSSGLIKVYCDYFLIDSVAKYISPTKRHNLELREYNSAEPEQEKGSTSKPGSCPEILSSSLNMDDPEEDLNSSSVREVLENWADTLNDSSMSDLLIFTKNMRQIWGHKLVFHTRVPAILNDMKRYENPRFPAIKDQIIWENVERNVAMAFLEYVYCGRIKNNSDLLRDQTKLTELQKLARRYEMGRLFEYLRTKMLKTSPADVKEKFKLTKNEPRANPVEGTQSSDDMFDDDSPSLVSVKTESVYMEDVINQIENSQLYNRTSQHDYQSETDQSSPTQNHSSQNKSQAKKSAGSSGKKSQNKSDEDSTGNQYFSFPSEFEAKQENNDSVVDSVENAFLNSDKLHQVNVLRAQNVDDMMTEDDSAGTEFDRNHVTIRKKTLTQNRAENELLNPFAKRKEGTVKEKRSVEGKSAENSAGSKISLKKGIREKSSSSDDFLTCESKDSRSDKESRVIETGEDADDSLVIDTPPRKQINKSKRHATSWEEDLPSTSREGEPNHKKKPEERHLIDLTIFDHPSTEVRQEKVKSKTKNKTPPSVRKKDVDPRLEESYLESVTKDNNSKKNRNEKKITRMSDYIRVLQTERDSDDSLSSLVQVINPVAKNIQKNKFVKSKPTDERLENKRLAISMLEKDLAREEPSCARLRQCDHKRLSINKKLTKLIKSINPLTSLAPLERVDSSDSVILLPSIPEKFPESHQTPAETPCPLQIRSIESLDKEVRIALSPISHRPVEGSPEKSPVVARKLSLDSTNATESEDESVNLAELSQYSKYRRSNENGENSIAVYREALFDESIKYNNDPLSSTPRSVVSTDLSDSSINYLTTRKRSAPEDQTNLKKPRIDQLNQSKEKEKEKQSKTPRKTLIEKDSTSSGSQSSDDDTLNSDEVKRRLKNRGFKDLGRFKNKMLMRRVLEEERLHQLSEPESSDGDDSPDSLTKFMASAVRAKKLKKKGIIKQNKMRIEEAFKKILERDEGLMEDVLIYKPIDLEIIIASFKSIGLKYKNSEILDFVENECITLKKKWKRTGKTKDST